MINHIPEILVLIRSFYLVSAASLLAVRLVPFTRDRFLSYGARESEIKTSKSKPSTVSRPYKSNDSRIISWVLEFKVPHSWFIHFYIISVCSSLFWLHQCCTRGQIFLIVANTTSSTKYASSPYTVVISWACLFFQGSRRLYECIVFCKTSDSRMWIGHYAIGVAFYLLINIAIWIESIATIESTNLLSLSWIQQTWSREVSRSQLSHSFALASKYQHDFHKYISALQKYTVPDQWQFTWIVAPHYTAECVIYLSLALLGAPAKQFVNKSLLCALIFVVINLGITADGTKQWMLRKFNKRQDDISKRWRMFPGFW